MQSEQDVMIIFNFIIFSYRMSFNHVGRLFPQTSHSPGVQLMQVQYGHSITENAGVLSMGFSPSSFLGGSYGFIASFSTSGCFSPYILNHCQFFLSLAKSSIFVVILNYGQGRFTTCLLNHIFSLFLKPTLKLKEVGNITLQFCQFVKVNFTYFAVFDLFTISICLK